MGWSADLNECVEIDLDLGDLDYAPVEVLVRVRINIDGDIMIREVLHAKIYHEGGYTDLKGLIDSTPDYYRERVFEQIGEALFQQRTARLEV